MMQQCSLSTGPTSKSHLSLISHLEHWRRFGFRFNIKPSLSIIKIRRSDSRLIFITGIPLLVRHLCSKVSPTSHTCISISAVCLLCIHPYLSSLAYVSISIQFGFCKYNHIYLVWLLDIQIDIYLVCFLYMHLYLSSLSSVHTSILI